ncbi:Solute carrier organic anion transporter family member 4A1 [Holothuria leucospilota]|uniref:Solute carrier organic anion transporter family member n=1 Tax=Holothuria leucospilota TaxID=206669 RepID=A0A9Q1BD47_HOLLE|nr:Solute carrier organic anion transporter family member 4A1 [Holothuria leucospilota]
MKMTNDTGLDNEGFQGETPNGESPYENGNTMNIQERGAESKDKEVEAQLSEDEDDNPCGWFGFRPQCIQSLNRPGGILLFFVIFILAQSTAVNGLVYVIVTTLERRFNLTSARSGSISSCYDFSVMIIILFVTYFGERAHQPRAVGCGALIFALGSFLFTVPHFVTEDYTYGGVSITQCHFESYSEKVIGEETCSANRTISEDSCVNEDKENVSRYYWFFVVAQVLHGIGASPLYTLGLAFLYNNTLPAMAALFVGIFQGAGMFAPAIGYIVGGLLLSIYTDLRKAGEQGIDPANPLWVGCWWLGFILTGTVAFFVSIPLLAYPRKLPGAKRIERERQNNTQQGSQYTKTGARVVDFPLAIWNLLTNVPYMCICLATSAENFIVGCIAVFGPKFVESVFTLTPGQAALLTGLVVIPASLAGCVLGGYIIKRFNWQYRGRIKFAVICLLVSLIVLPAVFIKCPILNFAGVTFDYLGNPLELGESNVTNACNMDCSCNDDYDPVCATTNVMYYSACHAGCKVQDSSGSLKEYSDCLCVSNDDGSYGGSAIQGKCYEECNGLIWFSVVVFLSLFFAMGTIVPSVTGIFEVVDIRQRTTALGLQSLFYRCLGTIPGPIVFGLLIDKSCMIWEEDCDSRKCWLYENNQFALFLFIIIIVFRGLSITFFTLSYFTFKPIQKEVDDEIKESPNTPVTIETSAGGKDETKI